jgi:predicted membrane-bound spermidine synthase
VGVFATALQVSVSRELLGLWGGSELAVALSLVLWLLGLSACSLLASRVAPFRGLRIASLLAGPMAMLVLLGLRLSPWLLNLPAGGEPSLAALLLLVVLFAAPAGGLVGFVFTTAAGLSPGKTDATVVYIFEAVGSLLAGSAFALLLAGWVPHLVVTAGSAALLFGLVFLHSPRRPPLTFLLGFCMVFLAFTFVAWRLEAWSTAQSLRGKGTLIAAKETPYTRAAVIERLGERQLYLDGRLADTFPEPYDKAIDVHLSLLQRRAPRSLLVLGAGPADRVEAALSHGLSKVVFVEMDTWLQKLLLPLWPASTERALRDPRVSIKNEDGRVYLSHCRERFDAILVHTEAPRSLSVARYHTVEAFAAAKNALAPGGVLTVTTAGAASQLSQTAAIGAKAELAALRQVFGAVEAAFGLEIVFHASDSRDELTPFADELARRLARRGAAPGLYPGRLVDIYDRHRAEAFVHEIEASLARPGEDLRPTAHLWAVAQWAQKWHGASTGRIVAWSGASIIMVLCLAAVVMGLATRALRRRCQGPSLGLWAIASTGLCGMSLQIVSLLVYQVGSGALYLGLSLLLGLFMAGLAAGAWFGKRQARQEPRRAVWISEGATLSLCLVSAVVLPLGAEHPALVLAFSPIVGAVTGFAFPVFLAFCRGHATEPDPIGPVTAADHVGAAVGALLTGLFLLPWLGVSGTALALALQKLLLGAWVLRRAASCSG